MLAQALLCKPETTVGELAVKLTKDEPGRVGRVFVYAEGEDGRRLAEDDPVGRPGTTPMLLHISVYIQSMFSQCSV